jgi:hypothetical protein
MGLSEGFEEAPCMQCVERIFLGGGGRVQRHGNCPCCMREFVHAA